MGSISEFSQHDHEVIAREYADLMETARKRCTDPAELEAIQKGFEFANVAHKGVRRRSGEPYILHPIAVAKIVASNIGLGYKSIVAALLHDVGKPDTFSLDEEGTGHFYGHPAVSTTLADAALRRLRVSNELREQVLLLIERHDLPVLPERRWVGRWLARLGEESFFFLLALKRADRAACADPTPPSPDPLEQAEVMARGLLEERACFSLKDLSVKGNDCITLGLKGKEIGSALQMLLDRVAEGSLPNEREALLSELKKYLEP